MTGGGPLRYRHTVTANGIEIESYCGNHGRSVEDRMHDYIPMFDGYGVLVCRDCGMEYSMDWQAYITGKRRPFQEGVRLGALASTTRTQRRRRTRFRK